MRYKLALLVSAGCLLLVLAFVACTETPTAGNQTTGNDNSPTANHNDPNSNTPQCPAGQHYDPASQGCVPNPDQLDPWGDEAGDGIPNQYDNCPFHYNPDQTDTSGDGVGDVCDNCPDHANPDQEYSDDNPVDDRGIIMGDVCVPGNVYADTVTDTSGDGVPDIMDNCPDHYNPPLQAGCNCPDSDPYCDACICECPDGFYPCDGCAQLDTSGDGAGDKCDNCPDLYNPNQTATSGNPVDDRGIVMGDACAPQPFNIPICASEEAQFDLLDPNVYISFDISLSMDSFDSNLGMTWMEQAKQGLDQVAEELHDRIRFGLGTYPTRPETDDEGYCDSEHILNIAEHSEAQLKSTWATFEPTGCTPMLDSLQDIIENDRVSDGSDPLNDSRPKAVLLVTDGVPNCRVIQNNQCISEDLDVQQVVQAIETLYTQGIRTYVVGFHINHPSLNQFAQAGGTDSPFLADNPDDLAQAMLDVADLLSGCTFELTNVPEDTNKIWVEANGEYLDPGGYSYDASDNILVFHDDTCDAMRSLDDDVLDITISMGCATECIPEQPQGLCDLWYETCGADVCEPCSPEICDGQDNNCSGVIDDYCYCAVYLDPCETTADCCEPFVCTDGVCDRECYPLGAPCRSSDDCCDACAIESGEEVGECISG